MKITAIAPWFGSKRTLAPRIVAELGEHRAYWEPFCGSMSVLLAKPACSTETVNDLHGELVNLARVIAHPKHGPQFFRQMRRQWLCEKLFTEAADRYKARGHTPAGPSPDLERAADFFVCSWFGRNGVSGTHSYNQGFSRRFTKNGGHAATRFCSAVDSIPAWHERMRKVTILNGDAFELLEKIEDADGVAIYLDPPYVVKGATYIHDFGADDHARMARLVSRFKRTRVVVSYYEHPTLRELYRGWTFVSCPTPKALVNQGMRDKQGGVTAPEILIINGESYTAPKTNSLFVTEAA